MEGLFQEPQTRGGYPLRVPCACGCLTGYIESRNGQDTVWCDDCKKHQYNAPRTETGKKQRSMSTTHEGISPSKRARIILRANTHCELSVEDGHGLGLPDSLINDDENLAGMCEECNAGLGDMSVSPRLLVALLMARKRKEKIGL